MKTITYPIILATRFPVGHCFEGEPTGFEDKLHTALGCKLNAGKYDECSQFCMRKLHTIRTNYEAWEKRFEKIYRDEAVLSIRVWEGRPYHSKQREIVRLSRKDGIGLQKLDTIQVPSNYAFINHTPVIYKKLAQNDGLSMWAWYHWLAPLASTEPMAIIHFTHFRY